uniref:Secreted protein n=1 Tax=Cucumis melo TaxID=3656 RepID=A0A9I9EIZ6_CUCME
MLGCAKSPLILFILVSFKVVYGIEWANFGNKFSDAESDVGKTVERNAPGEPFLTCYLHDIRSERLLTSLWPTIMRRQKTTFPDVVSMQRRKWLSRRTQSIIEKVFQLPTYSLCWKRF